MTSTTSILGVPLDNEEPPVKKEKTSDELEGSNGAAVMPAVAIKTEPPEYEPGEEPGSPIGSVKSESEYYEEVREPSSPTPAVKIEPPDVMNQDSIHLMDTELPVPEGMEQPSETAVTIKTEPQDPTEGGATELSMETGLDAAALQGVQPQLVPVGPGGLGTVLVQQPQWAPPAGADGAQPANIIYFHKVEQYGVGAQPLVSTQPVVAVQPGAELDQTVILPAQPARPESPATKMARLEAELEALRQTLSLVHRQKQEAEDRERKILSGLSEFLEEDQVRCLEKENVQGTLWSDKTLEKALKIWLSCGSRGYNVVREVGQPLPSERTLQRHLQSRKFPPEKLNTIMDSIGV